MDQLGKNFWYYLGQMGLASMVCTFVSVISYLQEATFGEWNILFATWAIGFIAAMVFYAGFNFKAIIYGEKPINEFLCSIIGTLITLLSLVLGNIAYIHMM